MSAKQSRRDAMKAAREQDAINRRIRLGRCGSAWAWAIDNMHGTAPTRHEAMQAANRARRERSEQWGRMGNAMTRATQASHGLTREFRRGVYAVRDFAEAVEP